ncbi:MarR family winged helix-turn-helix transcriptional regulator [Elstera cyanobacteriorum]|uniref:MarR family winged helix-turn-helix transcriptional regulator n=1 Tax=Elstera cyanobacteriorum TaxID=2022747 RepID=UPI002352FACF|nr:MarR family transcriptional regulator [Elstera cyanobacteriorum]MCK6441412.1 MarR family transcriptional regulator [Elstera cyanobacteriorum]
MTDPDYRSLNDCLVLHLRKAARRMTQVLDRALEPLDLTATQFAILGHLCWARDRGKFWSVQSLAEALAMDASSLTRALQPLIRRGLIEFVADPTDKRVKQPQATDAGRALFVAGCGVWTPAHDALVAQLGSDSAAALLALLKQAVAPQDGL